MTDPRVLRTRESMQAAALELAMGDEAKSFNVAAITQLAGINRATFYDHYSSVQDVLFAALTRDLDVLRYLDIERRADRSRPRLDVLRDSLEGVVAHIRKFEPIYRRSFDNTSDGVSQNVLTKHFTVSIRQVIDRQPAFPEELNRDIAAHFVAYALVGAIEVWVMNDNVSEKALLESVLASMPGWWGELD
ncbi:TetR/AcrR family transcriptional regulator [Gulosibacter molinativorax]|uniref:TetR/AcrR family transcriptional regulator n=1 Tax=Gulosibacter molinativorax TaxID=256821 RepID=A0ABT7CBQ4_9MICO|nr:TetR/AcrR family transcriptional regulator [Gulosibacter molinativorax]MDJ1372177.1 TetR/AcrR family transcriptional regulator [Gulosibacter molinativorax]QUY60952.1 Hypotetical protein [Gulosibacter molinativorax]